MNSTVKTLCLGTLLAFSQHSMAGDWSIGLLGGQSTFDELDDVCQPSSIADPIEGGGIRCDADDTSSSVGVNIAYNFDETFGVEAGFIDLGEFTIGEVSFSPAGPLIFSDLTLEAKAAYFAGTASYFFTDRWSVTGRAGIYDVDLDLSNEFLGSFDVDVDPDLYLGASIDYLFTDNFSAQLRYDDFEAIDTISLGLKYSFR